MPSLVLAIKTALKRAEGCMLSRRRLKEVLEPELALCGEDKATRKEMFASALDALLKKGKVTLEGAMVSLCARGEKRGREDVDNNVAVGEQAMEIERPKEVLPQEKRARKEDKVVEDVSPEVSKFREEHSIKAIGENAEALPDPFMSFDSCLEGFGEKIVQRLKKDYKEPSPIQAQSWPVALSRKDMVAVAKTGSGKTLSFLLPSFCVVSKDRTAAAAGPRILVLAPTRELATQIEEVVVSYAGLAGLSSACVYGGVPKPPQAKAVRSAVGGIVVATPGRLVDLLQDKSVNLQDVKVAVLDEADRMLDMGFQPQLSEIFNALPAVGQKQVLLFSATWPKAVKKMASTYLAEDHVHLTIGSHDDKGPTANTAVTQEFFKLDDSEKDNQLLRDLFKMADSAKVVIFTNTKRRADNLAKNLWSNGYGCAAVHGDKTQGDREKSLNAFKSGEWPILVATDVASRGLDITGVTHVVNFDMPRDVEGYVHRIGRTGRAGNSGASITYWNPDYDTECAPALAKIAKDAGQPVPEWLDKVAQKMGQGKKLWAVSKIDEARKQLGA
jgi:superfamily II DNA/RNA helicase